MTLANTDDTQSGTSGSSLTVRPARSREELEQAYSLVYTTYHREGYVGEIGSKMRLSIYNALPETVTFVALDGGEVMATVSLVEDTELGLPMDALYKEELDELREEGRKLSEVTMLAHREEESRRDIPVFLQLMVQIFDYVLFLMHADDVCIAVHPHHAGFYEKWLLFERVGPEKQYPSVRNNPAIALRLDFRTVEDRYRERDRLRRMFLCDRTPVQVMMNRYEMDFEDIQYLFADKTPVLANASEKQLEALRRRFPEGAWNI